MCSDDCVRRAFEPVDPQEAEIWLKHHLTFPLHPVMQEDWILDTDATVKPIYGTQEGAVVGCNPQKPGRPSHCYHSYMIANLRLILGVDVVPGNEHHGSHGLVGLVDVLDGLSEEARPYLVRGDGSYGTETVMSALEARNQDYLFKLRMTKRSRNWRRNLPQTRVGPMRVAAGRRPFRTDNTVPEQPPDKAIGDDPFLARTAKCAAVDCHRTLVPNSWQGSCQVLAWTKPKTTSKLVTHMITGQKTHNKDANAPAKSRM